MSKFFNGKVKVDNQVETFDMSELAEGKLTLPTGAVKNISEISDLHPMARTRDNMLSKAFILLQVSRNIVGLQSIVSPVFKTIYHNDEPPVFRSRSKNF